MKLDLTGQRFGQLTVAFRATSNRNNRINNNNNTEKNNEENIELEKMEVENQLNN